LTVDYAAILREMFFLSLRNWFLIFFVVILFNLFDGFLFDILLANLDSYLRHLRLRSIFIDFLAIRCLIDHLSIVCFRNILY